MSAELRPFHLSIVVDDLNEARNFYGELLGCSEGRSSEEWVDFNLFGHQLVCHLGSAEKKGVSTIIDGDKVLVPHFGVVLGLSEWRALASRLTAANEKFDLPPKVRFEGQDGEQGTFFLRDPFDNALEFKGFDDIANLFSK